MNKFFLLSLLLVSEPSHDMELTVADCISRLDDVKIHIGNARPTVIEIGENTSTNTIYLVGDYLRTMSYESDPKVIAIGRIRQNERLVLTVFSLNTVDRRYGSCEIDLPFWGEKENRWLDINDVLEVAGQLKDRIREFSRGLKAKDCRVVEDKARKK